MRSCGSGFSEHRDFWRFRNVVLFRRCTLKSGFAAIASPDLDSAGLTTAGLPMLCLGSPATRDCASANGIAQTPRSRSR